MNNFSELNVLLKNQKAELNALYKNPQTKLIQEALKITGLKESEESSQAILKRIIELKEDGLVSELKKAGISEANQRKIKAKMYDFVSKFYIKRFSLMLQNAKSLGILDSFNTELLSAVHKVGIVLSKMQKSWQKRLIDENSKFFKKNFKSIASANEFIDKHGLYQTNKGGSKADRIYGAPNIKTLQMQSYTSAFVKEGKELAKVFENAIKALEKTAKNKSDEAYTNYFKALKNAFLECDNAKIVPAWQEAERAWMQCRGDIQIGHPLEYYEDAYTHAVALEWDIRLKDSSQKVDETALKEQIKASFLDIYKEVCSDKNTDKNIQKSNEKMRSLVLNNIEKTQLYISNPFIYYGADFNGLFSAQVVPNDEIVSKECGKKIFAFVDFIHKSSKARPFSKLSGEIFSKDFLDFNRNILFCEPQTWKKIYEITTIGHEFGHIFFIGEDTENAMSKGGEFKFVEEFKATSGGLVNFFLRGEAQYEKAVFANHIARSVGLIGWQRVDEVRAYYCEGLIHLDLLFSSGALSFKDKKLSVDLSAYESYKNLALQNYKKLASHYANKLDSSLFLADFAVFENGIYLPKDAKVREFVEYYYLRYEELANAIDESPEWQNWQAKAIE